jgi:hypothetical protein
MPGWPVVGPTPAPQLSAEWPGCALGSHASCEKDSWISEGKGLGIRAHFDTALDHLIPYALSH